jgi:coenzyme F420-reducing hydrogenase gamma subunit
LKILQDLARSSEKQKILQKILKIFLRTEEYGACAAEYSASAAEYGACAGEYGACAAECGASAVECVPVQ